MLRRRPIWSYLLLATACAAPPAPPWQGREAPGVLRPATALPFDVLWHQRVTAHWGDEQHRGFDAAVQKLGDTLTVLGFAPTGAVGFTILEQGTEVELRNQSGQPMPFPPRYVLLDVQRTFYPWLPEATACDPADPTTREGIVDGERIRETFRDGRLVERTFARLDGDPAGVVRVRYDWTADDAGRLAPHHIELDSEWFGYRLTIDTHAEERLEPAEKG